MSQRFFVNGGKQQSQWCKPGAKHEEGKMETLPKAATDVENGDMNLNIVDSKILHVTNVKRTGTSKKHAGPNRSLPKSRK